MKNKLLGIFLFGTSVVLAQWNSNVTINTSVTTAAKNQDNVHIVTDNKYGAIMVWDDNRNSTTASTDIYAQRLSNAGEPRWTVNGLAVCGNTATQRSAAIIDVGNSACIIAWEDSRAGNYDIYAQKIDSSGNAMWAANGVALCSGINNQKNPKIISDNAGGAIVVWEDSLSFYWDVTAQRVSSLGVTMWATNGNTICNAVNSQINPKLDEDGAGGAFITWQDKRNGINYDIYAQRVDPTGVVQWTANGIAICDAVNSQTGPRIEPDENNGAYISWIDKRNGIDYDIYAQHINASGVNLWPNSGIAICNAAGNQSAVDMKNIGVGGLMLAWKDTRTSTETIYAQLISPDGTIQMPANGSSLSASLRGINPNVSHDAFGGAIIAWQDSTSFGWNITSQKINSAGIVQWSAGGVTVSNASNDQTDVVQVKDGSGGAIYAWQDKRNASNSDIFAQHLSSDVGIFENNSSGQTKAICFPNPISENSIIKITGTKANWDLKIYDQFGKLVLTSSLKFDEHYSLRSAKLSSGIYFYNASTTDQLIISGGKFVVSN